MLVFNQLDLIARVDRSGGGFLRGSLLTGLGADQVRVFNSADGSVRRGADICPCIRGVLRVKTSNALIKHKISAYPPKPNICAFMSTHALRSDGSADVPGLMILNGPDVEYRRGRLRSGLTRARDLALMT
jgi:hypothetical protein